MSNQQSAGAVQDVRLQCVAQSSALQRSTQRDGTDAGHDFYKHLQFSADGTCLIAQRTDHGLDTFVLPQNLLEVEPLSQELQVHSNGTSPSSLSSYAVHPSFALTDPNTTWVLSSSVDLPMQLRNALRYDFAVVSYPWVSPTTEQYISANSLLHVAQGSYFAAGAKGKLALFDMTRPGATAVTIHAADKHRGSYSEGLQDQGLVMALAESSSRVLAVGTTSRQVVLFPASGHGNPETHFSLAPPQGNPDPCKGTGIMSLAWSPCERYLIAAERQSDCMQIYDIRNGGNRLGWLSGRNTLSTQRFDIDLVNTPDGFEIWSGGVDGHVRMWQNPGKQADEQRPAIDCSLSDQPIGSARWHPSGAVLASCAGGRQYLWSDSQNDSVDGEDRVDVSAEGLGKNRMMIWAAP